MDTEAPLMEDNSAEGESSVPAESRHSAMKAPYMSHAGFKNLIEKLANEGIPGRFDKSYFGNISGSLVAQTRGTLYYFELIDDEQHPTDLLRQLVNSDEKGRTGLQRQMFHEKYSDALALSANATSGQLADVFRERGLSGATVTKAINFYLGMAEDVGVPLSTHFKKGRVVSVSNGNRKKRVSKAATTTPPPTPAAPTITSQEAQRAKYVDMLMSIAAKSDGEMPSTDLLDRIEKAIGLTGEPKEAPNPDLP